jgi:hypothetical protein
MVEAVRSKASNSMSSAELPRTSGEALSTFAQRVLEADEAHPEHRALAIRVAASMVKGGVLHDSELVGPVVRKCHRTASGSRGLRRKCGPPRPDVAVRLSRLGSQRRRQPDRLSKCGF